MFDRHVLNFTLFAGVAGMLLVRFTTGFWRGVGYVMLVDVPVGLWLAYEIGRADDN